MHWSKTSKNTFKVTGTRSVAAFTQAGRGEGLIDEFALVGVRDVVRAADFLPVGLAHLELFHGLVGLQEAGNPFFFVLLRWAVGVIFACTGTIGRAELVGVSFVWVLVPSHSVSATAAAPAIFFASMSQGAPCKSKQNNLNSIRNKNSQSINQLINQLVIQSINQPINQSIKDSTNQSINQSRNWTLLNNQLNDHQSINRSTDCKDKMLITCQQGSE